MIYYTNLHVREPTTRELLQDRPTFANPHNTQRSVLSLHDSTIAEV